MEKKEGENEVIVQRGPIYEVCFRIWFGIPSLVLSMYSLVDHIQTCLISARVILLLKRDNYVSEEFMVQ